MNPFGTLSVQWRVASAAAALTLATACGDVSTFKLQTSEWGETQPLSDWNSTFVQLTRSAATCVSENVSEESEGLLAPVGSHVEFPGEEVAALKSGCANDVAAEVSIDVEGRSIIYDFSSVSNAGVFTTDGFNGYVFAEVANAAPKIARATIDHELSTMQLDDGAIETEGHALRIDFAGMEFDATDFLKIDLAFD